MTRGLNMRLVVTATTAFVSVVYLVCVALQLLFPAWQTYTSAAWAATFPGFSWTIAGVVLGLVDAALYAAVGSALFVWIYNFFARRFAPAHA